jgi:quercetin dioxygenase-like cupin family protein
MGSRTVYDVYTVAYRFDPDVRMPPHSHPDRRSCFVLGGVWYFGYGTTFDPDAMRELHPGAHYTEPSNAPHFAASGPQGAVVECTAHGPSGTTFVNPADQ